MYGGGLPFIAVRTDEGTGVGVRAHVRLEVGAGLAALRTNVGAFLRVQPLMDGHVAGQGEALATGLHNTRNNNKTVNNDWFIYIYI